MTSKRILTVAVLILVLPIVLFFITRNQLLNFVLTKASDRLKQEGINLHVGSKQFEGLFHVVVKDLSLIPDNTDTLLHCDTLTFDISPVQWIRGNLPVRKIALVGGEVHLSESTDSTNNISFLFKNQKSDEDTLVSKTPERNYSRQVDRLRRAFSRLGGINVNTKGFVIRWTAPGYRESLLIKELDLHNTIYRVSATEVAGGDSIAFHLAGDLDPEAGEIKFECFPDRDTLVYLPFSSKIARLTCFTKSISGLMQFERVSEDVNGINFRFNAIGAGINHWRIGPDDVVFDSLGAEIQLGASPDALYTLDTSRLLVNRLPCYILAKYENGAHTDISIRAGFDKTDANDFFSSLPNGFFNTLEGIETKGKLEYHLNFELQPDNPDSLVFSSELTAESFGIVHYGKEDFSMINDDWNYIVRENDAFVRVVHVGPDNPYYTPLDKISPLLINAVLISEDGSYFFNHGFNREAFRHSIITNIKEKRFARGGSTITMQLVKNAFLNRNKTISRKVEEAIIVWLLDKQRIVSKERLLEVYLNIIEWGPGIYGIGEAAEFYFSKKPSELNLEESIYLSSIIPRPKYFMYSFEKNGTLKNYLKNYFRLVAGRMVSKEIISEADTSAMNYQVQLKGPALNIVVPPDTIPADSLFLDEPIDLF